jgi:hypothetical protein
VPLDIAVDGDKQLRSAGRDSLRILSYDNSTAYPRQRDAPEAGAVEPDLDVCRVRSWEGFRHMAPSEHQRAIATAKIYFGQNAAPKTLGWGVSGSVFLSPQAKYAVKVHHGVDGYLAECEAYRRLDTLRITELFGLTVPRMWDSRDDLRLIRMDYVTSPYLLDFAGVLFKPPDFDEEKMSNWYADIDSAYGSDNTWIPHGVYAKLMTLGMYYVDIRVSNLKLDGHPDYVPPKQPTYDDL